MNAFEFNWKVAGYAGEGIMTTGLLFSKTCARHGWQVFDYPEYPSLIRGGHNTYQVLASSHEASAQRRNLDLLIALNKNALFFHQQELTQNSLILYDKGDDQVDIDSLHLPCKTFNLPMVNLAEQSGGKRVMANNVALGASVFFLGLDLAVLNQLIADIFSEKGEAIVKANRNAAQAGYDYAKLNAQPLFSLQKVSGKNYLTATGNEAAALGAIAGGLQFYAAYPMTPSSSVLHYLAAKATPGNLVVKHAEDEISAINMALGASLAGARSMVGTSGGGFCYMTEALGLSGIAELPLVVFESMRPGPALGMPTWTAQGDLLFAINASQDEFPRIVLAPGDAGEMFLLSRQALELAEKYQTLVLILSDKHLSESRYTFELSDPVFHNPRFGFTNQPQPDDTGFFPRYLPTDSGISNRSVPGQSGGIHLANSYSHDQYGFGTEDSATRSSQMEKRFRKFNSIKQEIPQQLYLQDNKAKFTFISFGSTKGALVRTRQLLEKQGIAVNLLHLSWLWPFPSEQVKSILASAPNPVVVEGNSQGQLAKLIAQETGVVISKSINRYDGRPFYAEDIVSYVNNFNNP